jgi:hypothetical protein
MSEARTQKRKNSSLSFVEVAEVKDSVIVLREKQMRAVIAVSSANFALKSSEEQDMIIGQFQGLLNSLSFPVQILVQSRKLDLSPYIDKLKQLEDKQMNDLLRIKMQEYIEYIREMLNEVNIMNKEFYVIIGYEPVSLSDSLFGRFFRSLNPTSVFKLKQEEFLRNRKKLMSRVDEIKGKLGSLDLQCEILNTEQIIALLYNSYNPDSIESIRLRDVSSIDVEF